MQERILSLDLFFTTGPAQVAQMSRDACIQCMLPTYECKAIIPSIVRVTEKRPSFCFNIFLGSPFEHIIVYSQNSVIINLSFSLLVYAYAAFYCL